MRISLQWIFVLQIWSVPSCKQVKLGTCFTVSHFSSSCCRTLQPRCQYSSGPSLGRSTSEPIFVSTVVDESASHLTSVPMRGCAEHALLHIKFSIFIR